jgi:hypothetical protein
MAIAGIAGGGFHVASHQSAQPGTTHKHAARPSLSDIDSTGSSVATSPSATGKIGSKVNITA